MTADIIDQKIFGVYEFFANIIPGTIVLVTVALLSNWPLSSLSGSIFSESILVILALFLTFVLGVAIQGLSAFLESFVNKRKYGGYPSANYLEKNDNTFPEYFKNNIRKLANEKFGTPVDAPSQHIFDLCYIYIRQNRISDRVVQFLRTYIFARNMIITMIIEATILFYWSYQQQELTLILAGLFSIFLAYVFYKRFLRYSKSFSEEVFKSFLIHITTEARAQQEVKINCP